MSVNTCMCVQRSEFIGKHMLQTCCVVVLYYPFYNQVHDTSLASTYQWLQSIWFKVSDRQTDNHSCTGTYPDLQWLHCMCMWILCHHHGIVVALVTCIDSLLALIFRTCILLLSYVCCGCCGWCEPAWPSPHVTSVIIGRDYRYSSMTYFKTWLHIDSTTLHTWKIPLYI